MTDASGLAALFSRDLTRLIQELRAFPDDKLLWESLPGVTNSAGNLALHLEGNLREFIGRQYYLRRVLTAGDAVLFAGL